MYRYLLPIGTVVKTRSAEKTLMITGLLQKDSHGKLYDYSAVLYPEGFVDARLCILFQHSEIEEVLHKGLESDEHKALVMVFSAMAAAQQENASDNNTGETEA